MEWVDLLYLVGVAIVLTIWAGMAEEYVDHPGWLADAPFLRWTANVFVGGATAVAGLLLLYLSVIFWHVAGTVLLFLGALWLLAQGVVRLMSFLDGGDEGAEATPGEPET